MGDVIGERVVHCAFDHEASIESLIESAERAGRTAAVVARDAAYNLALLRGSWPQLPPFPVDLV